MELNIKVKCCECTCMLWKCGNTRYNRPFPANAQPGVYHSQMIMDSPTEVSAVQGNIAKLELGRLISHKYVTPPFS